MGGSGLNVDRGEVLKALKPIIKRKGLRRRPLEDIVSQTGVLMPYDVISFRYLLGDGTSGMGRTAINLFFASSLEEPSEGIFLLKPHLARRAAWLGKEVEGFLVAEPRGRGLDVLGPLLELRDRLLGPAKRMGEALARARKSGWITRTLLLWTFPSVREVERKYADEHARMTAFLSEMNVRLGLESYEDLLSLDILGQEGPFYAPSLVVQLEGPDGSRRHVLLDLSGDRPELDLDLTYLCTKPAARGALEALLGPS